MQHSFLPNKGNFRDLIAFQKSECIYDITYYFAKKYLSIGEMIQAARSCKQNIAEGNGAGVTSSETEIKLMNVAKASLQELLLDYEDYLRVRGLEQWNLDSEKAQQTRRVCAKHNDSAFYREAIKERNDGIKISLRSNGDADVAKVALVFGGGGHTKAAGCNIDATVCEAEKLIVKACEDALL